MSLPRRYLCALVLAGLAGLAMPMDALRARAAMLSSLPPVLGVTQVFALDELSGVALYGFDPVSYFLGEGPKGGLAEYEVIWSGVAWRFASAANREAFVEHPEAYAPRLGGYEATAAAGGIIVEANPLLFAVTSEGLYLFRSDHARARFMADDSIAHKAEERWSGLKRDLLQP
jgi:YHS domain-containing protein